MLKNSPVKILRSKTLGRQDKNKGFTLIELLVTIAIIGILVSIVFVNISDIKRKARNVKRLADIRGYLTAFEMAIDQNGEYPDPGVSIYYCLGDYKDNICWNNPNTYESITLNIILIEFIGLPASEYPIMAYGYNYNGYIYRCTQRPDNICKTIDMKWLMEGRNQSCGVGKVLFLDYDGNTFCGYTASL